ncbi:MAG: four helix bundle protein [Candidatus Doudnabacteria bacterium]|nr:four helix bundle protein [Candidatus Doudnabacteria bacterium]
MKIENFETIISWQKSTQLAVLVYTILKDNKDCGFKDQIQRAAVSIGNNIAEGYERHSNKEFKQFLYIAKGSAGEVRSMLYIAKELGYISAKDFENMYNLSIEICRLISGLIKTL